MTAMDRANVANLVQADSLQKVARVMKLAVAAMRQMERSWCFMMGRRSGWWWGVLGCFCGG